MLQSLSDAVISTDMEGRIVTINDAALELLGCPEAEEGDRSPAGHLGRAQLINPHLSGM
jgi:PAS domain-containing protein